MNLKLRNSLSWCFSVFLILTGFTRRAKKQGLKGKYILSIYFHSPSKALFEFCISWLVRNKFRILSPDEVFNISIHNKPFPKGGVIITIDDGWASNEENVGAVAEIYNIPVTIFTSTLPVQTGDFWWPIAQKAYDLNLSTHTVEYLKRVPNHSREDIITELRNKIPECERSAMTIEQLQRLSKLNMIYFGSHTVSHPILPNCTDSKSFEELSESKTVLEKWLARPIKTFAYPNGDYSGREINFLKDIGYEMAFTTKPEYLTEELIEHRYELPRFEVFEGISNAEAVCRMLGVWQSIIKN